MVINARLSASLCDELRPEQATFRPALSCANHANCLRIMIEQLVERRSTLYLAFKDFKKAQAKQFVWH